MSDESLPEFHEGKQAFNPSKDRDRENPYPWTSSDWWRSEAWEKGWDAAERQFHDDDDDDRRGHGGWPSTTGNPSGGGRSNAPPSSRSK